MRRRAVVTSFVVGIVGIVGIGTAITGCGSGSDPARAGSGGDDLSGVVTVLAASSLTESFEAIGKRFERAHPDVDVQFSFAASSELATQITAGAPADVFASASPETMRQVVEAQAARGRPTVFARNRLEIAVPAGNPGEVTGLADLGRRELRVALCAAEVPCGAAGAKALAAAGVTPAPDTLEADVKATLTKVTLGEVDAALVYRTDVRAAGPDVEGIEFPQSAQAVNSYPVVALHDAPNPRAARAFVDLVLSEQGTAVLTRAGFERP